MITISVCMIVKDEEKALCRCLDSLLCIADEIVIVDTGSRDGTMEIARRYTKKLHTFSWNGDFSAARNFAFSKCCCEYIYSADADEMLDQENQARFLRLKQRLLPDVEIVQMKYANQLEQGGVYNFDEEYRPKLFRRQRAFRWTGPIHETVVLYPVVYDSDVVIRHLPAHSNAKRDLAAFQRATSAGPLDKRLHHMYATELYLAGEDDDFLKAASYFQKTLTEESRDADELRESLCVCARAARLQGDDSLFFKCCLKALAGEPCAEICCELGEYYDGKEDWEEAYGWFFTAASGASSILSLRHSGPIPMKRQADCCKRLHRDREAEELCRRAQAWQPPIPD